MLRISLTRTWIKLWIFITFLPNKLGNNDRIAGRNLPNIDGKIYSASPIFWLGVLSWADKQKKKKKVLASHQGCCGGAAHPQNFFWECCSTPVSQGPVRLKKVYTF